MSDLPEARPPSRRMRWAARPLVPPARRSPPEAGGGGALRTALLALSGIVGVGVVIAAVVGTRLFAGRLDLGLPPGRLLVAPFVDATGTPELAWVERGMPELLSETLAETPEVELVPRSALRALQDARGLDPRRDADRLELRRLGFELGADLVLEATLERPRRRDVGGQVMQVAVFNPKGEVAHAELNGDDPVRMVADLAATVGRELGRGTEPLALEDAIAPSPFLARLYAMGVQELETQGANDAAPYFEIVLRYRPELFLPTLRLSECELKRRRPDRAKALRLELLKLAESHGRRRRQAEAAAAVAEVLRLEKKADEAIGLLEQAGRLYEKVNDRAGIADTLLDRARLQAGTKDVEAAEASLRSALELQTAVGDVPGQVATLFDLAPLALRRREPEDAAALLRQAREVAKRAGDTWLEVEAGYRLASILRRTGDLETAVTLGREVASFFAEHGGPRRELEAQRELAESLVAAGDLKSAEEPLQRLLELSQQEKSLHNEAIASVLLARVLLAAGYPYQARTHLMRAIELDEQVPDRIELQVLIGWLAYDQGAFRVAAETLRAAKRQAGKRWGDDREALLVAFEQALAKGERVPLPGETGPAPAPRAPGAAPGG